MNPTSKQPTTPTWVMLSPIAKWVKGPRGHIRIAEKVSSESRTIPDDSFSIYELFNRFKKGQPLPLGLERPINYSDSPSHDDLDLESIRRMDLTTVSDYQKRVSDTLYFLGERQKALQTAQNDDKTTNQAVTPPPAP